MTDAFGPAIAALENDLKAIERKARGLKEAINTLCFSAGIEPKYNVSDEEDQGSIANIRGDTFYGKTIGQAAREYLEMRKASGIGPAEPKEVYQALVAGGMQFNTSSETNAQISVSNTLRKSSRIFHRLPSGQYGLLVWYPNAKSEKDSGPDDVQDDHKKSAADDASAADPNSSDAPIHDQEAGASEP